MARAHRPSHYRLAIEKEIARVEGELRTLEAARLFMLHCEQQLDIRQHDQRQQRRERSRKATNPETQEVA